MSSKYIDARSCYYNPKTKWFAGKYYALRWWVRFMKTDNLPGKVWSPSEKEGR